MHRACAGRFRNRYTNSQNSLTGPPYLNKSSSWIYFPSVFPRLTPREWWNRNSPGFSQLVALEAMLNRKPITLLPRLPSLTRLTGRESTWLVYGTHATRRDASVPLRQQPMTNQRRRARDVIRGELSSGAFASRLSLADASDYIISKLRIK